MEGVRETLRRLREACGIEACVAGGEASGLEGVRETLRGLREARGIEACVAGRVGCGFGVAV